MHFRLFIDGDGEERQAWSEFVQAEFPEYEQFWLSSVVPLTTRPAGIHFKADHELPTEKSPEDIAIAQLHYTLLKNLRRAHALRGRSEVDDYVLSVFLSFIVGAQDVAFEMLERNRLRGTYDPWLESGKGVNKSGQDARKEWQKSESYPLHWIRDYRNKLLHGRTPPALSGHLPRPASLTKYADWRKAGEAGAFEDFEDPRSILARSWEDTLAYLRTAWRANLLPKTGG